MGAAGPGGDGSGLRGEGGNRSADNEGDDSARSADAHTGQGAGFCHRGLGTAERKPSQDARVTARCHLFNPGPAPPDRLA
ncbi:hypothetical protein SKAU_G00349350 [Synaphobranchus kaupii]|uniref:Uncharacterized protein n=1 Tax=Synaphobranchus kaupii TaxID=118154 RepID=A0A9Q1EK63_SYNKA|nr:hypothetical protein SKAU_G00349350 [Synaphobranchus kaupii]